MEPSTFFHTAHTDRYVELLAGHDVLVALPLSFQLINTPLWNPSSPTISHKIPLHITAGFSLKKIESERSIQLHCYDPSHKSFQQYKAHYIIPHLDQLLQSIEKSLSPKHLSLTIVADAPPGRGLHFFQHLATVLAAVIHIAQGQCTAYDLHTLLPQSSLHTSIKQLSETFYSIMVPSNTLPIHTPGLFQGSTPFMCSQEKITALGGHAQAPKYNLAILYCGYATQERSLPCNPTLSGKEHPMLHTLEFCTYELEHIYQEMCINGPQPELWKKLYRMFDIVVSLQKYLGTFHPALKHLLGKAQEISFRAETHRTAISPLGSSLLGGSLGLLYQNILFSSVLHDEVRKLQKQGYPYELTYSSALHGPPPSTGIQVQSKNTSSTSIMPQFHTLIEFKNNTIKETYVTHSALHTLKEKGSLVLNEEKNSIHLCGKKLTAKELKSRSTTISLFEGFYSKKTFTLSNKDLPKSSYTTSRNEFMSKIVSPLKKAWEEHCSCAFPLQVTGNLNTFTISLHQSQNPLYFVPYPGEKS